jgi:GntR family transcriptional regulator
MSVSYRSEPGPKRSLVDLAEDAVRSWLATGRHRPGERLPPEHELSAMLGVSRGTLRTALERLEDTGEIVRRQGSGTYVGRGGAGGHSVDEGLEKLESYSLLARGRGIKLTVRDLELEPHRIAPDLAAHFGVAEGALAPTISRVVLLDGEVGAYMRDVIHPDIELPPPAHVRRAIERGQMVMDILQKEGMPIAFSRTQIMPRLLTSRDRIGRRLGVRAVTAAVELEEVFHTTGGDVVQSSVDVFLPQALDLHVIRQVTATARMSPIGRGAGTPLRARGRGGEAEARLP